MSESRKPEHHQWAWRIGNVAGIGIYIHATFLLLLVWIAMSHLSGGHDVTVAAQGLLLVIAVFGCVVLHELGHALVARKFGIATRDITLYPIGGVARLERMPDKPAQELAVAIAGPAVNAAIALVIFGALQLAGVSPGGDPLTVGGSFAVQLMWINISLAVFNLLPAFPMDGGRILRGLLGLRMDRARATAIAARVGRGIAVVMGIAGLVWNPTLALIAVFVWMAAGQEAAMERMKLTVGGAAVADAMVAEFETLPPELPLRTAAERLARGFQHDFPVVDGGRVIGMLTRDDIVRGLAMHSPDVADVMHRQFAVANAREELASVLGRMPPDGSSLLVVDQDRAIGLLDAEHLGSLVAMRGARPAM